MQPSRRCASTNGSIMPCACACSRIQRSDRMVMVSGVTAAHFGLQSAPIFFLWMQRRSRNSPLPPNRPRNRLTVYPQLQPLCYFRSRWRVAGQRPRRVMAEVIRIAESAEPAATAALPQNVEAEAALLGALMIDNRLVEDVQLKLKPHHFFEPLHGRIYEAILQADRPQHGRQPGDAAADVRGRRGDEGGRRAGLSGPADRLGRGGHRRARFRRSRSTTWPCCGR